METSSLTPRFNYSTHALDSELPNSIELVESNFHISSKLFQKRKLAPISPYQLYKRYPKPYPLSRVNISPILKESSSQVFLKFQIPTRKSKLSICNRSFNQKVFDYKQKLLPNNPSLEIKIVKKHNPRLKPILKSSTPEPFKNLSSHFEQGQLS